MLYSITLLLALSQAASADSGAPLASLNAIESVRQTYVVDASRRIEGVSGEGESTDGDGALLFGGHAVPGEGSKYFGIVVPLAAPVDLRRQAVLVDARTPAPETTKAFYVRLYNRGESKPAWSFSSWSRPLAAEWRTFTLQHGLCLNGLAWEANVVEDREASQIDRIEFIIGTREDDVDVAAVVDNLRTGPHRPGIQQLTEPKKLVRDTVVVADGRPAAVVLHPNSDAGREAAGAIVAMIEARTGVAIPARPGTPADRRPEQTALFVGDVNTNPAMLLLYARYMTPVDGVCPGTGGALVHTVFDPFGLGVNAVVVGASDFAGLDRAVELLRAAVEGQPAGGSLALPRLFERAYGPDFLDKCGWADDEPAPDRLDKGLAEGRAALDKGRHTSIAGVLAGVANRYQLTGHSVEAKLFVDLWAMYAESAVADPRKFGGPWGFDSDFPSGKVVPGWRTVEYDPILSDEERLATVRTMGRWLEEAVVPSCIGAAGSSHVPHNHQTFPALGTLFAGLYFTEGFRAAEGEKWLGIADAIFRRQAAYYKPYEDCNGYQWLTNGHLMRYTVARPDLTLYENGNARRIIDFCIGNMDNLGYQVPYGDTGSWKCWDSETICLDTFAFVTNDAAAAWAAALKHRIKDTKALYGFQRAESGLAPPTQYDGVRVWPLEPQYYATHGAEGRPALEDCFDKISFRAAMDPEAAYLLLDGLSNGGHRHYDGNSIPRITQFNRIWLADNDYYKSAVKYHNSMMVFRDGESGPVPNYIQFLAAGESPRYGFSRTRAAGYAGVDWDRTIVWLKEQQAFVVLDRLTASQADEYQFRLLWHGIGAATLSDGGLLLEQQGPAMRLEVAPGPELRLHDDAALGTNWSGYPYAEPVVRSLSAIATIRLDAGESYLFATAIHGSPSGAPPGWAMEHLADIAGVRIQTDAGPLAIAAAPCRLATPNGALDTDAHAVVADSRGLSVLGATSARAGTVAYHTAAEAGCADIADAACARIAAEASTRPPIANLKAGAEAPEHRVLWRARPEPPRLVLTGNRGVPGAVDLGAALSSDPPPAEHNVFAPAEANREEALLDGQWGNSTATSVMYDPGRTVTLTVDLQQPCTLDAVRWMQWWATTSSRNTSYLLRRATVLLSDDNFTTDVRQAGIVTDDGPHPDFGSPLAYRVSCEGQRARWVRLIIEPQAESAVYLAQLLVEGACDGGTAGVGGVRMTRLTTARLDGPQNPPALLAATGHGPLFAFSADGAPLWTVDFSCQLNDVCAGDLDGDGK
ncbi:MAG: hypothetical protein JXR94_03505, partial [Candidatus Hydrogenedentes bacterium]|nr:hypothetical protein [Candidatus Hydrogenedentota bacterium]